ncbi:MAG TPA: insulinase family protein [Lacunisphaera sp.]|nr:insulinase family protein [Lacunisphaera sp.]
MLSPIRRLSVPCLIAGLLVTVAAASQAVTGPRSGHWAHEGTNLKPDSRVLWGRLENGLRYALLPHQGVPGRVVMKLAVLVGSVDEEENEQGIAHFTEHMAFHGSGDLDEAGLLSLFRRLGAEYGSDVNAFTTFDSTTFSLEFRENDLQLLAQGFRMFKGVAGSTTFDQAAIDRERRVIFAEKRNRNSLSDRQLQASYPVIFRGANFAHHSPIGIDETLNSFHRENFLNFYHRNYRPDLMVVVVAGDFEVGALEKLVRDTFEDLPKPTTPPPARPEGRPDIRNLRAGVFRIPGVGSAETTVASVVPTPAKLDPREAIVRSQRNAFVMELFENRLRDLIPGAGSPQATYEAVMNYEAAIASVRVPGEGWTQGLLAVDQVIRDTLRRGFEASEIKELRERYLRNLGFHTSQLPVMDPAELCEELTNSIIDHSVFVGPATSIAWMTDWLTKLTPDEVNRSFRAMWAPDTMAFNIAGDVDLQLKPDDVVKSVQKHRRGESTYQLPPPPKQENFTLKKPGPVSPLAESRPVPSLGVELMRFGNNVRVNFIPTRYEPGVVNAVVRIGDGLLTLPGKRPALKEFGLNTLIGSGTVFYQTDQIARIIDQRFLDFSFDLSDNDAFTFRGLVNVPNLETFLGVVTEIIRSPKFNPYAHRDERLRAAMGRSAGAMGFSEGQRDLMDYLFQGDARFMSGTVIDYVSLSVNDVRQWMEGPLTSGYIEVTLVGDLSREQALAALSRTLGTLGPRAANKTRAVPPAPVKVAAPAGFKRIEFVGEMNMGMVRGNWPVNAHIDARTNVALQILSKLLEFRIRTEARDLKGYAYSPQAAFDPFGGFEDFGLMQATVDCTPVDAQAVAQIVQDTAAKLAAEGATAEEFEAGRNIIRNQLRHGFQTNGFLVGIFKRVQEKPGRLEQIQSLHDGLADQVTLEEVNKWAKQLLPAANARTAMIVPKAFVGIFEGVKQ